MIRAALTMLVAAAGLTATAGGAWLAHSGSALAPEPARLSASLSGANGAAAAAVYRDTDVPATVVKWTASYVFNTTLPAGKPCSTTDLAAGDWTGQTIQAIGNYRRCV